MTHGFHPYTFQWYSKPKGAWGDCKHVLAVKSVVKG